MVEGFDVRMAGWEDGRIVGQRDVHVFVHGSHGRVTEGQEGQPLRRIHHFLRLQRRRTRPHDGREGQQRHVDQVEARPVLPDYPVVLAVQQAEGGDAHGQAVHARQGGVGHGLGAAVHHLGVGGGEGGGGGEGR